MDPYTALAIAAAALALSIGGLIITAAVYFRNRRTEDQGSMNEEQPQANFALAIQTGRLPAISYAQNPDDGAALLATLQPQGYPLLIEIRGPRLEIWRPAPSLEGQGPKRTLLLSVNDGYVQGVSPHIEHSIFGSEQDGDEAP